jgi:hypothetical protein
MPDHTFTPSPSSLITHVTATLVTPACEAELKRWNGFHGNQSERSAHTLSSSRGEYVCQQCRQIDFQKVMNLSILTLQSEPNGILVADLGVRYNLAPQDDCRLCHILYHSRQKPKSSTRPYHLRVYSYVKSSQTISFNTFPKSQLERDIPCLGVVPANMTGTQFRLKASDTGHLFCVEDGQPAATIFTPRLVGESADFVQLKEWLNFCKSFHAQCKGSDESEDQVDGLKLIDCLSGSIVPAPQNAAYVALSYVWGQTDSDVSQASTRDKSFETLGSGFSKTVEDAILATKSLGYQFLWVDKFCIDQNNPEEKHHQISQMETIYKAAEVTIIASSGRDCHYGLPGVGRTPRRSQDALKLGKFQIISSMIHPHQQIPTSPWAARAWTLQEAVLSPRRLVFTDDQVYFECAAMNCSETLSPTLDLIHKPDKKATYACFHSGILSCNTGRRFANPEIDNRLSMFGYYMELVSQYSRRRLSFEEDRLKAFTGIVRHFTRSNKKVFQLWGVPYYGADVPDIYKSFLRGLLWAHKDVLEVNSHPRFIANGMTSGSPGAALIPSWAWVKGGRGVYFPRTGIVMVSMVSRIRLEFGANSWVDFDYYHRATWSRPPESASMYSYATQPQALLLDAQVLLPSEILFIGEHVPLDVCSSGRKTEWYLSYAPDPPKVLWDLFQQSRLQLVALSYNIVPNIVYFMVVETHRDFFLRVGLCLCQVSRDLLPTMETSSIRIM